MLACYPELTSSLAAEFLGSEMTECYNTDDCGKSVSTKKVLNVWIPKTGYLAFLSLYFFIQAACAQTLSHIINSVYICKVKVTQSCLILCDPMDCPWDFPGQNTGVGSQSLLQGIFPNQGSSPGLLHCRRILYQLSLEGSPRILEWGSLSLLLVQCNYYYIVTF